MNPAKFVSNYQTTRWQIWTCYTPLACWCLDS